MLRQCCAPVQAEADAWCAQRPPFAWPPAHEQLRTLRVAIVMEPVCQRWVLDSFQARAGQLRHTQCRLAAGCRGAGQPQQQLLCRLPPAVAPPAACLPASPCGGWPTQQPCHVRLAPCRQEGFDPERVQECMDAMMHHCDDLSKNGCYGAYAGKLADNVVRTPDRATLCTEVVCFAGGYVGVVSFVFTCAHACIGGLLINHVGVCFGSVGSGRQVVWERCVPGGVAPAVRIRTWRIASGLGAPVAVSEPSRRPMPSWATALHSTAKVCLRLQHPCRRCHCRLQCQGVLPASDIFEADGVTPVKFQFYQRWWQTVMTMIAPELRSLGWANLK